MLLAVGLRLDSLHLAASEIEPEPPLGIGIRCLSRGSVHRQQRLQCLEAGRRSVLLVGYGGPVVTLGRCEPHRSFFRPQTAAATAF